MEAPKNTHGIDWTGDAFPAPDGRHRTPAAIARRRRCAANRARKRAAQRAAGAAWFVACAYDGPFGARGDVLKGFGDYEQAARYAATTDPGGSFLTIKHAADMPQKGA